MKVRDYLLTGVLLLSIGLTLGTLLSMYLLEDGRAPLSEVSVTEVTRSNDPFFTDESLEKVGAPFLFKKIAENVTPTVVYIETIIPLGDEDDSDSQIWNRMMPRRARTVGSGVIITTDGYILTNNHVIEDAVRNGIRVVLSDKREFQANVVGTDPTTDLAVIKITADNLQAAMVGNSDHLEVGEWVVAIGNPFRLRSTVTAGIVSALSRDVQIINDRMRIESFIQTDAAINKGNSGGALVNTSGQLIGINTAIASQSGSYQGYGFAVPSNLAVKVAEDIIEHGEVKRALLGVSIAAVDYTRAQELGLPSVVGVEILGLAEDGAAREYGLQIGDVVLEVNDLPVNESNELQEKVAVMRPGDFITLTVFRNGDRFDQEVRLKELITEEPQITEFEIPEEGIELDEMPLDDDSDEEFRVESYKFDLGFKVEAIQKGDIGRILITEVDRYSEAWNRSLKSGHEILAVDGTKVEDLKSLRDLVHSGLEEEGNVTLKVLSPDKVTGYIQLKK
jgi:Do/DeqQ family serine protease